MREQQVARVLQGPGDGALVLGRKMGVFARQNLARVGDVTPHRLRIGERNFRRRGCLLLLFSGAHVSKKRGEREAAPGVVNLHFGVAILADASARLGAWSFVLIA